MKKTLFALLLATSCCQISFAQTTSADITRYSHYTVLKQLLTPAVGDYLQKAHPDKTRAEPWKQTADNGNLVKADVRMMVERLAW